MEIKNIKDEIRKCHEGELQLFVVCVCVCVRARARVCVCVCVRVCLLILRGNCNVVIEVDAIQLP